MLGIGHPLICCLLVHVERLCITWEVISLSFDALNDLCALPISSCNVYSRLT